MTTTTNYNIAFIEAEGALLLARAARMEIERRLADTRVYSIVTYPL